MRIRIGDADFVHKVYIVNKSHYDWVLGNDFLQKFIRKMNFIDKTMTTQTGVELTFHDDEKPTNSQLEIHLGGGSRGITTQPIQVPGGSKAVVTVLHLLDGQPTKISSCDEYEFIPEDQRLLALSIGQKKRPPIRN